MSVKLRNHSNTKFLMDKRENTDPCQFAINDLLALVQLHVIGMFYFRYVASLNELGARK